MVRQCFRVLWTIFSGVKQDSNFCNLNAKVCYFAQTLHFSINGFIHLQKTASQCSSSPKIARRLYYNTQNQTWRCT